MPARLPEQHGEDHVHEDRAEYILLGVEVKGHAAAFTEIERRDRGIAKEPTGHRVSELVDDGDEGMEEHSHEGELHEDESEHEADAQGAPRFLAQRRLCWWCVIDRHRLIELDAALETLRVRLMLRESAGGTGKSGHRARNW